MKNTFLVLTLLLLLTTFYAPTSIASSDNRIDYNYHDKPATVTCYSGGVIIYKTVTKKKVRLGSESTYTVFLDSDGNWVEASNDCIYEYNVSTQQPQYNSNTNGGVNH